MSLSLIALSVAGMLAPGAALGIVALLVLTKLMPGIVNILKMMEKANLQNGLRNALALSVLLNAFSSVLVILAMVGMTGLAAYNGILALTTLIVAMGGLMLAIGALSKHMPKMEEFINKGIDILCQVAYGIGKFIGSFVGGITAGIVSGLPEIGLRLSQFMILAMPFIQGAKQIDKKALTGIGILTASIIALCAAELITSITKFLTLGGTFADLGTQLSMFMLNATPFIMGLKMISPQLAKAAKNMAETVLILTAADMVQGLSRFLGLSDKDPFTKLSTQLEAFGDGMIKFYDKVKGIENVDKFKTAAEGAKYLVEVAKSIPNEGGLLSKFTGDNTLEGFGKGIKSFGQAMIDFAKSIAELDDDKIDKIRKSAKAGEAFTKMANTIPNDGGLFSIFAGDNTLKGFAKGMQEYGKALAAYGAEVVKIDDSQVDAITYSVKAGTAIIKMSKQIENEGGLGSIFTGNKSLKNFSENLKSFGEGIVAFGNTILGRKSKIDAKKLEDIAAMMSGIGNAFKYMKDVKEKDAKSFKNALDTLARVSIDNFVEGFDVEATTKVNKVKETLKTFMDGIIKYVKDYKDDFKKAGKHLVNGFANGITEQTFKAEAAASAMAEKSKKAAKKTLDEHSPSKEFFEIGAFAGQGFINALYAYADKAYNASEDMAGSAKDGFSRAIASVAKTIENGIDDDLTIRPVLDLSNVEEGARSIADMLGSGQSIGTMTNINAISTGINRNLQNRRSDEMLSAIKDLGKSLNNAGTTNNYNVNGVSYSGDEEISNAIETLVRAATVEGRV
jgi:predicted small secreted protein